jgi:hypothetical protein
MADTHALLAFDIHKGTATSEVAGAVRAAFEKQLKDHGWGRVKVHAPIDTTFTKVTADNPKMAQNVVLAMFLLAEREKNLRGTAHRAGDHSGEASDDVLLSTVALEAKASDGGAVRGCGICGIFRR